MEALLLHCSREGRVSDLRTVAKEIRSVERTLQERSQVPNPSAPTHQSVNGTPSHIYQTSERNMDRYVCRQSPYFRVSQNLSRKLLLDFQQQASFSLDFTFHNIDWSRGNKRIYLLMARISESAVLGNLPLGFPTIGKIYVNSILIPSTVSYTELKLCV